LTESVTNTSAHLVEGSFDAPVLGTRFEYSGYATEDGERVAFRRCV
jgi:hypothetical protein